MTMVRPPAVAGSFYPSDAPRLGGSIVAMLADAPAPDLDVEPRALIVPHAGYVYSGAVAAAGYRLLQEPGWTRSRVVLMGPSHFVRVPGLATAGADGFATPLGIVPVDGELSEIAEGHATVAARAEAHHREHSLEVQLPFVQVALPAATVVPLLTGDASAHDAAAVLNNLLDASDVLAVISSDLSHYLDYSTAYRRDTATAAAIEELRWEAIGPEDACGHTAVGALLIAAASRGWSCQQLALANSGDAAGTHDRVVGYGAFVAGPDT